MEEFDEYGFIRLDQHRFLKKHSTCIRHARKCDILSFARLCERIDCSQQHYPVMFRVNGYLLNGPEYQTYLIHGAMPCPTR